MSALRFAVLRVGRIGITGALVGAAAVYGCGDGNRSDAFVIDDVQVDAGKDTGPAYQVDGKAPVEKEAAAPKVYPPSAVTLGDGFACVVAKDRAVYCWGKNDLGQLGSDPAKLPSTPLPTKVEGLPFIAKVKAGKNFACALDVSDRVWCWGNNQKGQLNTKEVLARFKPDVAASKASALDAAGEHVCILNLDNFVYCWGDNACDLFGRPDTPIADYTKVSGLPSQAQLSLGPDQMCTVAEDSSVLCWGTDHKGSLGHPLPSNATTCNGLPFDPTPKRVQQDGPVITFTGAADVHVGLGLACVRKTDGTVMCWGDNSHGGLGQGVPDTATHMKPTAVPALVAASVHVGGETGCAVAAERLLCWGDARYGQLDSITDTTCNGTGCRPLGYVVPGQQPLKSIAVSASNIATIKGDNTLWVWGKNDSGEVGASSSDAGNVSCAGGSKCTPVPRMLTTAPPLSD